MSLHKHILSDRTLGLAGDASHAEFASLVVHQRQEAPRPPDRAEPRVQRILEHLFFIEGRADGLRKERIQRPDKLLSPGFVMTV